MRYNILSKLSNQYNETEEYINKEVNSIKSFNPFSIKTVKDREVIDKSNISRDELIVLDYYKILINNYYKINYPNRSYIMTELVNIVPFLHLYNRYVIYKFDFKNFFYNISLKKSLKFLKEGINLKPNEYKFLKKYTEQINECVPGIGLHNSLVEVCGKHFDNEMKESFKDKGLIFYARYVDDCILILDEKLSEEEIENTVLKLITKSFGVNLKLNDEKTQYFTSECVNFEIDYLGYAFQKGQSLTKPFKIGISKKKIKKYTDKINKIIQEYRDQDDIELLDYKLDVFFKRIVYYGDRKNDGNYRWQVRGISDSYKELKRFMNREKAFDNITNDTEKLFSKTIEVCFNKNRVGIPPKIQNQLKHNKFVASFLNNRAILLHSKIGLTHKDLKKKLEIIYDGNVENCNYSELARKLLHRIK
jgi:hypothetical protein